MGDVELMRNIVRAIERWNMKKQWLTQCDRKGRTPLHLASICGYLNVVRFIVQEIIGSTKDADLQKHYINITDHKGRTSLFHAAAEARIKVVHFLAEHGADLEAATAENHIEPGSTPLMACAAKNNWECFKILLDKGANVLVTRKDGADATYLAARYGHIDIIEEIAETKKMQLIVNRPTFQGRTALLTAAFHGHIKVCKSLYKNGANLDHQDNNRFTALILSASEGYFDLVKWLVEKGANVHIKDRYGETASTSAENNDYFETARYLRKWNDDSDSRRDSNDSRTNSDEVPTKLKKGNGRSGRYSYPSEQLLTKTSATKRFAGSKVLISRS